jgi:hypothetical protein
MVAEAWPFGRAPSQHRNSDQDGERFLTDQERGPGFIADRFEPDALAVGQ